MTPSFRDLVDQFLTGRRARAYETEEFETMMHDRDLVATTDRQLARIASAYGYFTALSFETQGINDNGSDVSVRYRSLGSDDDSRSQVLGFQIKSDRELKEPDTMGRIKAQRDDAFRKIPDLSHYYILLCGNELKRKKRLNAIRAEFLNAERTTVVSPTQMLPFVRREGFQIDAQVKRLMDESDMVLRAMRECLDMPSDTAKAIVCLLAAHLLCEGSATMTIADLRRGAVEHAYARMAAAAREFASRLEAARRAAESFDLGDEIDEFEDADALEREHTLAIRSFEPETAFADDIEQLSANLAEQSSNGSAISLSITAAAPVIAVAADAMVRYGYTRDDVVLYLLDLAGVEF